MFFRFFELWKFVFEKSNDSYPAKRKIHYAQFCGWLLQRTFCDNWSEFNKTVSMHDFSLQVDSFTFLQYWSMCPNEFYVAFSSKLTSPRWKNFKGLRLQWKDKIRLNNLIWRCWHMQCKYLLTISNLILLISCLSFISHRKKEYRCLSICVSVRSWPT